MQKHIKGISVAYCEGKPSILGCFRPGQTMQTSSPASLSPPLLQPRHPVDCSFEAQRKKSGCGVLSGAAWTPPRGPEVWQGSTGKSLVPWSWSSHPWPGASVRPVIPCWNGLVTWPHLLGHQGPSLQTAPEEQLKDPGFHQSWNGSGVNLQVCMLSSVYPLSGWNISWERLPGPLADFPNNSATQNHWTSMF